MVGIAQHRSHRQADVGHGRPRRCPNSSRSGAASASEAIADGTGITAEAIAAARATGDPALLLEALVIGSLHFAAVGLLPDVLHPLNEEAGELAESLDDSWHIAMVEALARDGQLRRRRSGDIDGTAPVAIDALRKLGDETTAALFEIEFSEVAELRGDIAGATSAMAAALEVNTENGFMSATVLRAVLCWLTGRNNENERSLSLGQEVVALAHQPFNPVIRAQALFALGAAETWANMPAAAAEHLGEALVIHRRVGMQRETAMDHRHIGILHSRLGETDRVAEHLRTAIQLAVEVGLPWTVMLAARSLAKVLVGTDPEMAARLLGNSEAVSALFGYLPTPDEKDLSRRPLLLRPPSSATWESPRQWQQGRSFRLPSCPNCSRPRLCDD